MTIDDVKEDKETNNLTKRKRIPLSFKDDEHWNEVVNFYKKYGFTTMQSFIMELIKLCQSDKDTLIKVLEQKNLKASK